MKDAATCMGQEGQGHRRRLVFRDGRSSAKRESGHHPKLAPAMWDALSMLATVCRGSKLSNIGVANCEFCVVDRQTFFLLTRYSNTAAAPVCGRGTAIRAVRNANQFPRAGWLWNGCSALCSREKARFLAKRGRAGLLSITVGDYGRHIQHLRVLADGQHRPFEVQAPRVFSLPIRSSRARRNRSLNLPKRRAQGGA
jgi:hypothetical protein